MCVYVCVDGGGKNLGGRFIYKEGGNPIFSFFLEGLEGTLLLNFFGDNQI